MELMLNINKIKSYAKKKKKIKQFLSYKTLFKFVKKSRQNTVYKTK